MLKSKDANFLLTLKDSYIIFCINTSIIFGHPKDIILKDEGNEIKC
jgi:hypothetical protein